MDGEKTLSVCIVTYNNADKIADAVTSVKENTHTDYTLYISDNGSSDGTKEAVKNADPHAVFIENGENLGFGRANNTVLKLMNSEYHAVINPDISFDTDVLSRLCHYLDTHPEAVMVTPKILWPDGKEQILPKRRPTFLYLVNRRLHFSKRLDAEYTRSGEKMDIPTEIEFCTGCFFVIRSKIFKRLSGFDERFFMYLEDADITLRALKYGKAMFIPDASVTHHWERSSAKSLKYFLVHIGSMFKFLFKHRGGR